MNHAFNHDIEVVFIQFLGFFANDSDNAWHINSPNGMDDFKNFKLDQYEEGLVCVYESQLLTHPVAAGLSCFRRL